MNNDSHNSEVQQATKEHIRAEHGSGCGGQFHPDSPLVGEHQRATDHHQDKAHENPKGFQRFLRSIERQWKRDPIAVVALLTAVGLVWLTYEQVGLTREQIYRGERAYLLIQNVRLSTPDALTADSLPDLKWDIINVGRTPAQHLITRYAIYIGPRGAEPPDDAIEGYSEGRTLGPGEKEPSPSIFGTWLGGGAMAGKPLGDRMKLLDGDPDTRLYLNARITVLYDTVFPGVSGRTDICAYYEGSRFSYCGVRGTTIQ